MGRKKIIDNDNVYYAKLREKNLIKNTKERWRYKSTLHRNVKCVETGMIFSTYVQAAKSMGLNKSHIRECCYGERATHGGYHFIHTHEFNV